ncbi:phage tail protein [Bartonella sp. ML70XJBT.G]|uniref:phage tail protein n=1 Tax=Bartonella sp. ML70XJBT.G TaxID=3019093 RepID=UPI0023601566|nr:phage tail protein [Bartonella sp. ML70XJBT.G]
MSSIYNWSLIASENAYADENINWAEGQPPSSVNDSARAMMQRIKEYLLDNGGVVETQFSFDRANNKTAIHLITKSSFGAYEGGIVVRFRAQEQNSGITNVALNRLLPRPVYMATPDGLAPLKGGEMQRGGLYELVYTCDIAGKNVDGWFLTNPTQSFLPPGFIGTFATEKVPSGWLLCDGKAYSREAYASLFAVLGEIWGRGDGRTTFNVPDLRGMFLRGLDSGKNIDKGRRLGSRQEESFKAHSHQGKTDSAGAHTHKVENFMPFGIEAYTGKYNYYFNGSGRVDTTLAGAHEHKVILEKTGGDETRPVNVAVVYAIKA